MTALGVPYLAAVEGPDGRFDWVRCHVCGKLEKSSDGYGAARHFERSPDCLAAASTPPAGGYVAFAETPDPGQAIEAALDETDGDPDAALDLVVERYSATAPELVSIASEVLSQYRDGAYREVER